VHAESWVKITVVLFDRQVHHLDRAATRARRSGHKSVSRASLIRGLIDGILNSGLDLSQHSSETTLRDHLVARLGRTPRSV
jgi:hypothetical protein